MNTRQVARCVLAVLRQWSGGTKLGNAPTADTRGGAAREMGNFEVKDSGERVEFDSGMVRDTDEDKVCYALVLDGPMLDRWAEHLTKGAKKYEKRNWMLAAGREEYDRFRESAFRHFIQWYRGDTDEDHAAAVYFNINGAEYVGNNLDRFAPRSHRYV